jgi:glucan biosynthesis protein C
MEAEVQGAMLKQATRTRLAYADNLKVVLVAGVIVAHVTMAFAGLTGAWVLNEPPVREPLLSLLDLSALVGALFGMPLFFLVAGMFTPGRSSARACASSSWTEPCGS